MTAATTTPAERLLAALAGATAPMTQAELALAAGCGRSTATTALGKLAAAGSVVRHDNAPGRGPATYTLADAQATEAGGSYRGVERREAEVVYGSGGFEGMAGDPASAEPALDEAHTFCADANCAECTAAEADSASERLLGSDTYLADAAAADAARVEADETYLAEAAAAADEANPEVPAGGAAIPTAADMTAGLTRGTWKQLGAVLGDTVEVLTLPHQERVTGELTTSGGKCFLVTEGGRQVALGGWAAKQYGRLVKSVRYDARPEAKAPKAAKAAAPKAAPKAAAAPAEAPTYNGAALELATLKAHGMKVGDRVALLVEGEVREGTLERDASALYYLRTGPSTTYAVGGGQRPVYAVLLEAGAVEVAEVERTGEVENFNGLPRLARGELRAQVIAWLQANPEAEVTPGSMGKALGGRNSSACNGVLRVLTEEGVTEQTSDSPKRFRLAASE